MLKKYDIVDMMRWTAIIVSAILFGCLIFRIDQMTGETILVMFGWAVGLAGIGMTDWE